ncbi:MAG TPA: tryptophan 7-halogenase [Verrucomicrobiae bacterium]
MSREVYDFVVIGSGFGGSIMSMVLRRLGKAVLMVEQGKHPRFAIGESSTPFANLLLEQIADDYDLPFLRDFAEWGSWQEKHPNIAVGLKRGFTFYHHEFGTELNFSDRARQLLVAASPNDRVADTHWYRPQFDECLLRKAVELGVSYLDETTVSSLVRVGDHWEIELSNQDSNCAVKAGFIIDATSANCALARHLPIEIEKFAAMPRTSSVWAHFRNVKRLDEFDRALRSDELPYPPDDAAVHHVFPGGWIWVLRFNNGITSAGAAYTEQVELSKGSAEEKWSELITRIPLLAWQFKGSEPVTPFFSANRLSFIRSEFVGPGWALLPSAAGFVDPLLSTGFALTLLGITRLAGAVSGSIVELKSFGQQTRIELDAAADLVGALYAKMDSFDEFALLALLYFAAMSYTETVWRLGKNDRAAGFLLSSEPEVSRKRAAICADARAGRRITQERIADAISAYDIAGLCDWKRDHWYPVNLNDLVQNREKVGASEVELNELFRKLKLEPLNDQSPRARMHSKMIVD